MGGAVGGSLGLLALLALALLCFRRRRQRLMALNDRPSPLLLPQPAARFTNFGAVGSDPFGSSAALSASGPSGTSRPLQTWSESDPGSTHNPSPGDASNPSASPVTDFSHARTTPTGNDSATSSVPISAVVGAAAAVAVAQGRDTSATRLAPAATPVIYPNEKAGLSSGAALQQGQAANSDAPDARPNPVLTDNQADFVNSLFNNNVPAPVVARVLERMLANPQGGSGTGYNDPELRPHLTSGTPWQGIMSDIGDGETTIGTAPPSYDYARAQ